MNSNKHKLEPSKGQFLVYQAEDGTLKLDVRLEDETVWLTQQLMSELFQTTIPNISMHISNIYEEEELRPEATVKKFLTVRTEGNRQVKRPLDYYNLDMIISVGYRVKSRVATRFRIWATGLLKEYIVKGFAMEDETVWLTQQLMAELFQKDVRTINHHIQSIYKEEALKPAPTIRKYRIVQMEKKRQVPHHLRNLSTLRRPPCRSTSQHGHLPNSPNQLSAGSATPKTRTGLLKQRRTA